MPTIHRPIPVLTPADRMRFKASINQATGRGPFGRCWEWLARRNQNNYGLFDLSMHQYGGNPREVFHAQAHRVSFYFFIGIDPGDEQTLHKCDNPPCVNPDDLFLGTAADNIHDAQSKGRIPTGENCYNSVLTELDVVAICEKYQSGNFSIVELAVEYATNTSHISQIVMGTMWQHVQRPVGSMGAHYHKRAGILRSETQRGANNPATRFTERDVIDMRMRYDGGEKIASIARSYNAPHTTVSSIVKRQRWKFVNQ